MPTLVEVVDAPRVNTPIHRLRSLLSARQDHTAATTRQSTQLRGLLLSGDGTDRKIARTTFTEPTLLRLARRRKPRNATHQHCTHQHCMRHVEIKRLALALIATGRDLKAINTQLQTIVDDLEPGLTERRGIGPISAAHAIAGLPHPLTVPRQRRPVLLEEARIPRRNTSY